MRTIVCNIAGGLCLAAGGIGIFVPVFPTTPFVILAAVLFSGNKRVYVWLSERSCFKGYIENYKHKTGLTKKTVLISCAFLWTTLAISAIVINRSRLYFLLLAIGLGVTIHILWISRPRRR